MSERYVFGQEQIWNPEISSLLEPVHPQEFLYRTSHMALVLGKLSDMGHRTMKGDVLQQSGGLLGWQSATGDIGHGEEIAHGWKAFDEEELYAAELQVLGHRAVNPRRIRFEIPGFPRSDVAVSSVDYNRSNPNVRITYHQQGIDLAQYEINIRDYLVNEKNLTVVNFWKRTRGFQREITLFYVERDWRQLFLSQGSLVRLDVYDALTILHQGINELYRSENARAEVKDILVENIRRRAATLKQLMVGRDLDDKELRTYADWISEERPVIYFALRQILELTGRNPQEIDRCILAVQAGSNRVPMPLGQLGAMFYVRKSSVDKKPTRLMPPQLDLALAGAAAGLSNQWRRCSAYFAKENFHDFILLESEVAPLVFDNLTGIRALIVNGVKFK